MSHACHRFWNCYKTPHVLLTFDHCACHAKQDLYVQKCSIHQFFRTIDFDFEMCFAPQRCALFRHLNFQKWSEHEVFLYILSWTRASCHSGVQFFISHPARWLRTRRFSEPTCRLSGATNQWKNTVSRDFPTFRAPASSFFWLFPFSDLLSSLIFSSLLCSSLLFPDSSPPLLFHLSILSEVWLLNFLRRYQTVLRMSHEDVQNQLHQI